MAQKLKVYTKAQMLAPVPPMGWDLSHSKAGRGVSLERQKKDWADIQSAYKAGKSYQLGGQTYPARNSRKAVKQTKGAARWSMKGGGFRSSVTPQTHTQGPGGMFIPKNVSGKGFSVTPSQKRQVKKIIK